MSIALESALKAKGKTVQFVSLPDVGHDFLGKPVAALKAIDKALENG